MKFREGDVVSPITGGFLMTVEDNPEDGAFVSTIWFDRDGVVQRDAFDPSVLQKWQRITE